MYGALMSFILIGYLVFFHLDPESKPHWLLSYSPMIGLPFLFFTFDKVMGDASEKMSMRDSFWLHMGMVAAYIGALIVSVPVFVYVYADILNFFELI